MSARSADWRVEWALRAVALGLLAVIVGITVAIFLEAWPSFQHNGLAWFGSGGSPDQQENAMVLAGPEHGGAAWHFRAWPLIWGTIVTCGLAVLIALAVSILAAVFIVELAPGPVRRVAEPTIAFLAGVPSVCYGLVGILVIAPWFEEAFISQARKQSVIYVVNLSGANLAVGVMILTIMVLPIMVALIVSALQTVPRSWTEGSAALGVNRWRTIRRVSLRAIRPAIVAAVVLAIGRALGESIMLAMVAGSHSFAPNPLDGLTFFFEPVRTLASAIIAYFDGFSIETVRHTLYALGLVVFVSAALFALAGWAVKQPLKRYAVGT